MGLITIGISNQWHTTNLTIRREGLDSHQPRNIFVAAQTIIGGVMVSMPISALVR